MHATVAITIANTSSSSSGNVPRSIESVIRDRSNSWIGPITTMAVKTTRLASERRSTTLKRAADTPWKFVQATQRDGGRGDQHGHRPVVRLAPERPR